MGSGNFAALLTEEPMHNHFRRSLLLSTLMLLSVPAFAAEVPEVDSRIPRLDIGGSVGINNPAGIYGIETDYRFLDRVSAGLSGGSGAWGPRISGGARVYPFAIQNAGLFLEAGLSLNVGGSTSLTVNDETVQEVDMLLTPTANTAIGYRAQFKDFGWTALKLGYGLRLRQENIRVRDGSELNPLLDAALSLSQPGGFLVALSGGFSIL